MKMFAARPPLEQGHRHAPVGNILRPAGGMRLLAALLFVAASVSPSFAQTLTATWIDQNSIRAGAINCSVYPETTPDIHLRLTNLVESTLPTGLSIHGNTYNGDW